jgi:GMP synthase-like glutamine amidotransferase
MGKIGNQAIHLGIIQCDHVRETLSPQHGQFPEMFMRLLLKTDPTLKFTLYDAEQSHLPIHIDACDAYLITGSRHSVNDDLPWIGVLEELVVKLHAGDKKVIGICFGHQLVAKALGGKVCKSATGWSVGMSQNQVIQEQPWMIPSCDQVNMLVSHQDQVLALPPKANILASNNTCPIFIMQIGQSLTIQGHPEFSKAYSQALMEHRKDVLGKQKFEQGLQSLALDNDDALISQWVVNFLRS